MQVVGDFVGEDLAGDLHLEHSRSEKRPNRDVFVEVLPVYSDTPAYEPPSSVAAVYLSRRSCAKADDRRQLLAARRHAMRLRDDKKTTCCARHRRKQGNRI